MVTRPDRGNAIILPFLASILYSVPAARGRAARPSEIKHPENVFEGYGHRSRLHPRNTCQRDHMSGLSFIPSKCPSRRSLNRPDADPLPSYSAAGRVGNPEFLGG